MSAPSPAHRIATFSIAATDGRDWGVAVASKFLAVGSAVPAASAAVGAVATQAMANTSYRGRGLDLLAEGRTASEVVDILTAADPQREHRQLGVVDRDGRAATFTGSACFEWAGGRTGKGCACQGNILAGAQVVDALLGSFETSQGKLGDRLLRALAAADAAGGDRRGRQSAAILVARAGAGYGGFDDRMIDLRVDDHPQPVAELARLVEVWRLHFEAPDPADLIPADETTVERLKRALERRGRVGPHADREAVFAALEAWAGIVNLEERCGRRDVVDPLLLAALEADPGPG
ncbi:MAG: DUF1028 domain-containing protein [Candidatus Dormibacteria bacterium]